MISPRLFGLDYKPEESRRIVLPVPWDATTSYRSGTAGGPQAILEASSQLDLYHPLVDRFWEDGLAMVPISDQIEAQNQKCRQISAPIITALNLNPESKVSRKDVDAVNKMTADCHQWVESACLSFLEKGKSVALIGGEHSVSIGLIRALGKIRGEFGVLQIDAHMDLRESYQGFIDSHASVMSLADQVPAVSRIIQVGVRDFCEDEQTRVLGSNSKIRTFSDWAMKEKLFSGMPWSSICDEIVAALPDQVYISFDIDGLEPGCCPHTGTLVPGGLSYDQAIHLLAAVWRSGKQIIGADLVEVAPGPTEWDGNVGSRLIFFLLGLL
ncbi:MAG: agmatinase [Candidatus Marinamargulisbacteria bacterium]|jgi:agmatinase